MNEAIQELANDELEKSAGIQLANDELERTVELLQQLADDPEINAALSEQGFRLAQETIDEIKVKILSAKNAMVKIPAEATDEDKDDDDHWRKQINKFVEPPVDTIKERIKARIDDPNADEYERQAARYAFEVMYPRG